LIFSAASLMAKSSTRNHSPWGYLAPEAIFDLDLKPCWLKDTVDICMLGRPDQKRRQASGNG